MNILIVIVIIVILIILLASCVYKCIYNQIATKRSLVFNDYSDIYYYSIEDPPNDKKMKMIIKTKV